MIRFRNLLVVCALAVPVPVVIAGCGGDDGGDVDPQTVLDETFNNDQRVSSGDLSLSLGGSAEGAAGGSFEASLEGPFQGDPENPNAIPQLDWTGTLSFDAAGQSGSFEGGIVVTDDNAYVEYGGSAYELGEETFSQFKQLADAAAQQQQQAGSEGLSFGEAFKQGCEAQIEAAGGDTAACDVDFEAWLSDLSSEGTEDVEGTESDHISGSLNVETMLNDLIEIGGAVPQAAASGIPTEEQVQQVADAVDDASFDLYSTTEDHILNGLDFSLSIDPSAIPDAEAAGIEDVGVDFSLRIGAINEDQTIEAPSDAQPLDQLLEQFGIDPSQLGGVPGLGGGADTGGGGGGATGGDADAYFECIEQAQSDADFAECAALLQ